MKASVIDPKWDLKERLKVFFFSFFSNSASSFALVDGFSLSSCSRLFVSVGDKGPVCFLCLLCPYVSFWTSHMSFFFNYVKRFYGDIRLQGQSG